MLSYPYPVTIIIPVFYFWADILEKKCQGTVITLIFTLSAVAQKP